MSVTPYPLPSGATSAQIVPPQGSPIYLRGWFVSEDTGLAPAKVQILDKPGGNVLLGVTLAPNESIREFFADEAGGAAAGITVASGQLYKLAVSGTATVTVFA